MDVLFPKIGEIIGGSQREENLEKLMNRIHEMEFPKRMYGGTLIPVSSEQSRMPGSDSDLNG